MAAVGLKRGEVIVVDQQIDKTFFRVGVGTLDGTGGVVDVDIVIKHDALRHLARQARNSPSGASTLMYGKIVATVRR